MQVQKREWWGNNEILCFDVFNKFKILDIQHDNIYCISYYMKMEMSTKSVAVQYSNCYTLNMR